MLPVSTLIEKLREVAPWADGESLDAIRARLTPKQLAEAGKVIVRISERGVYPWLLRARVEQEGALLFEIAQRLPETVTHATIELIALEWQRAGYLQGVSVHYPES